MRISACNCSIRPVNENFKGGNYRKNTMVELKGLLEMIIARPDTSWKTTTPLTHSCSNDGVIQLGPLGSNALLLKSSRSVMRVLYTFSSIRCSQLDLSLANSEVTVAAKWTLAFLFLGTPRECEHFDDIIIAYIVLYKNSDGTFIIFKLPEMWRWILPEITKICWSLSKLCPKY